MQACGAYVKPGTTIRVTLRRREASGRGLAAQGQTPTAAQWQYDCAGQSGPTCSVTLDKPRTVYVDWNAK